MRKKRHKWWILLKKPLPARTLIITISFFILLSCNNGDTEEWDGFYGSRIAEGLLQPCGLDSVEYWHLVGDNKLLMQLSSKFNQLNCEERVAYVRLFGIRSEKNIYTKEFKITEILEMRCPVVGDCECDCD